MTTLPLLGEPVFAVLLGAALGVGSVLISRASARLVTPDDPMLGFARMALVSAARMLAVIAALAACFFLARPVFVPFAVALVTAFLATLGYEVLRATFAARRPTRTS